MEANELMIDDWMRHANGTPMQVTRIDYTKNGGHFACGFPHCWEYNNKFDPIPLTAELLERNGFKKVPQPGCTNPFHWMLAEYEDDVQEPSMLLYRITAFNTLFRGMFVSIDNPSECETVSFGKQIEFVHELQHALRLCNIDKEIIV